MIPLTVCLENAQEIIPDWRRRVLEGEARKFADNGFPMRSRWRFKVGETYWDQIYKDHECLLWQAAYWKRIERLKRTNKIPANHRWGYQVLH